MRVGSRETSIFMLQMSLNCRENIQQVRTLIYNCEKQQPHCRKEWSAGRLEREKLANQELAQWIQHCLWEGTSEPGDLNTCHYRCGQAEHPGMVQQTPRGLEKTALQMCFLPSLFFRQLSDPM